MESTTHIIQISVLKRRIARWSAGGAVYGLIQAFGGQPLSGIAIFMLIGAITGARSGRRKIGNMGSVWVALMVSPRMMCRKAAQEPAPTVHADGHEYDADGMRISFLTASVSEVTPVLHWDFAERRYVGDPGTYRATDPTVAQAAIERAMAYGNAQNPPTDRPLALPDERGWFTTHGGTGVIGYLGNEPTPGGSGYAMMMSNGIARWTPQQQIAALQHAFHAPQFYPGGASYKAIMERRSLGR